MNTKWMLYKQFSTFSPTFIPENTSLSRRDCEDCPPSSPPSLGSISSHRGVFVTFFLQKMKMPLGHKIALSHSTKIYSLCPSI